MSVPVSLSVSAGLRLFVCVLIFACAGRSEFLCMRWVLWGFWGLCVCLGWGRGRGDEGAYIGMWVRFAVNHLQIDEPCIPSSCNSESHRI